MFSKLQIVLITLAILSLCGFSLFIYRITTRITQEVDKTIVIEASPLEKDCFNEYKEGYDYGVNMTIQTAALLNLEVKLGNKQTEKLLNDNLISCPLTIKNRIIKENLIDYKCSECDLRDVWMDNKLTLELHHIDSDRTNNKLDNLTFLCPNCHSQTYKYRKKKGGD